MGLFEILGDEIMSATGNSASEVAANLIGIISPVVASGAAVYLIWYGFKVSHGQVANIGGNTLMLGLKIALISILILNAPNFMKLAEGGKNALESALSGALGANNTYAVFDGLYLKIGDLVSAFIEGFTDVGWSAAGVMAALLLLVLLILIGGSMFALFSVAFMLLITNDLLILVCLGFGPAFAVTLLFPALSGFFSAWLRALIVPVVAKGLIAFVIHLIETPLDRYLDATRALFNGNDIPYQSVAQSTIVLCIIFLCTSGLMAVMQLAAANLVGSMTVSGMGTVGGSLFSKTESSKSFFRGAASGVRGENPVPLGRAEGLPKGSAAAPGGAAGALGRGGVSDEQAAAMPKGDTLGYSNAQYLQAYQRACGMNDIGRFGYQVGAGMRMGYQGGKGALKGIAAVENGVAGLAMRGFDHVKGMYSDRKNRNASGVFQ